MIYLDNAATSYPKPEEVYIEQDYIARNIGTNPGRSGHSSALSIDRRIYTTRKLLKELINAKNIEDIIFTFNGTDSLNLGIKGILKKGDHVVTTSLEHNSVLRPLVSLEKKGLIEISVVGLNDESLISPKDIESEIRENTKLVVVNHISNVIGSITDIEKIGSICKKYNILYLVDAAQSIGSHKIDVEKMNIDMLAFPGHKGLWGPQGTGGLYIREGIELSTLKEGGTGSSSENLLQPEILPDRYESGTLNGPGIGALGKGIEYINKVGIDEIRKRESHLTQYFLRALKDLSKVKVYGPKNIENRGPVVSINIGNVGSSEIAYILDSEFNIAVRPGLHCAPLVHKELKTMKQGMVRFSLGYFNTIEELDFTLNKIEEIAGRY